MHSLSKSHFGAKLAEMYNVPHISIQEVVDLLKNDTGELGQRVHSRIEELKEQMMEDLEKSKKKK